MRQAVWSIAAGLVGLVLCAANSAGAAPSREPIVVVAHARASAVNHAAPPTLLAQTIVPTPVVAMQPVPAVVAQGHVVRVVTPDGSQPGVLWLIAMGAILYRFGARILRVS